ncbi:right-handed parallel beta-helix repeat-containing protein, partial [Arthrospira platensis SPKY2]
GSDPYIEVYNCTISGNFQHGIYSSYNSLLRVTDTIIANNSGWGIYAEANSAQYLEYIGFYGNSSGTYNYSANPGTGILYSNPRFVSGQYGSNYLSHTSPISPCIDAGSMSSSLREVDSLTTDPDGT